MSHGHNRNFADHFEFALDRVFTAAQPIPVTEWISDHLTLDSDGSTIDMTVDGTTPKSFAYTVPAGKLFILSRVIWSAADLDINYLNWFGFGAALANGCVMKANGDEFLHALKTTIEFAHLAGADLPILAINRGVIPDAMVIRWSLFKAGYVPIFDSGETIEFLVQDNLTEMDHFECVIQGRVFDA